MRKVLYLLLLFGLVSCSLSNDEVIIENNVSRPTAYEIKVDELLFVDRIGVYDSLLIVINRKVEPIFCVYDSRTFAFKGSFGKIGHGPGDFQFPFFLKDKTSKLLKSSLENSCFKEICTLNILVFIESISLSKRIPPLCNNPKLSQKSSNSLRL